jgi:hypothetical protein
MTAKTNRAMVRLLIFSTSADRRAQLCGFSAASFLFDGLFAATLAALHLRR